jgi:glycerol uptake facilitator-like aquaporin
VGSILIASTVIGSGIMAERLSGGNVAVALLANTGATVAVLIVLIGMLGPVSGAHFNPAVSLIQVMRQQLPLREGCAYAVVQIAGCVLGAFLAHAMFEMPLIQASTHVRAGAAQWLSEVIATGGLILVVLSCSGPQQAAWRVAAWIGAAYWFTASTSFANPAITIGRAFSDTFAGIRPADAPGFMIAQVIGAVGALYLGKLLFDRHAETDKRTAVDGVHPPAT